MITKLTPEKKLIEKKKTTVGSCKGAHALRIFEVKMHGLDLVLRCGEQGCRYCGWGRVGWLTNL